MSNLDATLTSLATRFDAAVREARDAHALEEVRVAFLGRSGEVTAVRRAIGSLPPAERPEAGKIINARVAAMEARLAAAFEDVERTGLVRALSDTIDVTFPGPQPLLGALDCCQLVLQLPDASRVELVLVERLVARVAGLHLLVAFQRPLTGVRPQR